MHIYLIDTLPVPSHEPQRMVIYPFCSLPLPRQLLHFLVAIHLPFIVLQENRLRIELRAARVRISLGCQLPGPYALFPVIFAWLATYYSIPGEMGNLQVSRENFEISLHGLKVRCSASELPTQRSTYYKPSNHSCQVTRASTRYRTVTSCLPCRCADLYHYGSVIS